MLVRALLEQAGFEVLNADPTTQLFTGRIYYNDTSKVIRIYFDGVWNSVGGGTATSGNVNFDAFIDSDCDLSGFTADAIDYGYFLYPDAAADQLRTITLPPIASGEFDQIAFRFFSGYFSDLTVTTPDATNIQLLDGSTAATYTIRGKEFVVLFYEPDETAWVITDEPDTDIAPRESVRRMSANLDLTLDYITNRVANGFSRYDIPSHITNESVASGSVLTLFDHTQTDPFITDKVIRVNNPVDYSMDISAAAAQNLINDYDGSTPATITLAEACYAEFQNEPGVGYHLVDTNDPALAQTPLELGDLKNVDDTTTPPEDGQAIVWSAAGSEYIPGASGDSSFKLQAINSQDLTIKSGSIILDDSRELYTATDITVDLSALGDDSYYFYIDLSTLPAATDVSGREVYTITDSNIVSFPFTPVTQREVRYVPLGGATKSAGVWQDLFNTSYRRHDTHENNPKNYVISPDTPDNLTVTGGMVKGLTTTSSELPEQSKLRATTITQSGGNIGDTATWDTLPTDDGDGDKNGSPNMYIKTLPGYNDDEFEVEWIDGATSQTYGTQAIKAGTTRIDSFDLPLFAGVSTRPRIRSTVTLSSGIAVSGVGTIPETRLTGSVITDWQDYTPTNTQGFGTITSRLRWRQVGTSVEVIGDFDTGTVVNLQAQLELPNSYTIDLPNSDTIVVDSKAARDANVSDTQAHPHIFATDGETYVTFGSAIYSGSNNETLQRTGTQLISGGQRISINFSVPVAELNGSVMFGTEAQSQNARLKYNSLTGGAISTSSVAPTVLLYTNEVYTETDGLNYDNSTGAITANFTGKISVSAQLLVTPPSNTGSTVIAIGTDTGSGYTNQSIGANVTAGTTPDLSVDLEIDPNTTYYIKGYSTLAGTNITASSTYNYLSISRIGDKSSKATGFPLSTAATENEQYLVPDYRETTVTLASSGDFTASCPDVKFIRIGNTVTVTSEGPLVSNNVSNPSSAAGVVPEGFRPTDDVYQMYYAATASNSTFAVQASGAIFYYVKNWSGTTQSSTTSQVSINISYVIT